MRRTAHLFFAAALTLGVIGPVGCSSDSGSPTDDNAETPDGSFCSLYVAFRTSDDSLSAEVSSGDADRARAALSRLVGQADLLRKKAPAEIKSDVDLVSNYVVSLDRLFAEYGYDVAAFDGNAEASAKFQELRTEEVDSSLLQLRTYAETDCASGGSTTSTTATVAG